MEDETPHNVLKELSAHVVAQLDKRSAVGFDTALEELLDFHKFLIQAYSFQENGQVRSFAENADWVSPLHFQWAHEHFRIFEASAKIIHEDNHYAQKASGIFIWLLARCAKDIGDVIATRLLSLPCVFIHRVEDWLEARSTVDADNNRSLPRPEAKAYEDLLSSMVSDWEWSLTNAQFAYEWKEAKKQDDAAFWSRLSSSWPYVFKHLENTAYILSATVWGNDAQGAKDFGSSFIKWLDNVSVDVSVHHSPIYGEIVFPDFIKASWIVVDEKVTRYNNNLHRPNSPWNVFVSILNVAYWDMLLLASGILTAWFIEGKTEGKLILEAARGILTGHYGTDEDDFQTSSELRLEDFITRIIRLRAVYHIEAPEYYGYLEGAVANIDRMSERRILMGRHFTPSTKNHVQDLMAAWALLALDIYVRRRPDATRTITYLGNLVAENIYLEEGQILTRTHEALLELATLLENTNNATIASYNASLRTNINEEHRSALVQILRDSGERLKLNHNERIRRRNIEEDKIAQLREDVSKEIPKGIAHIAPFQEVALQYVIEANPEISVNVNDLPKGMLLKPEMARPLYTPKNFVEHLLNRVRHKVITDLIGLPRQQTLAENAEDFWGKIKNKAQALSDTGQKPILLGGEWLNSHRTQLVRQPQPVAFHGFSYRYNGEIRNRSYWGTLDDMDVYVLRRDTEFSQANHVIVFPANLLTRLNVTGANSLPVIGIEVTPTDNDLIMNLKLSIRIRPEWQQGQIAEFLIGTNTDIANPPSPIQER